MVNVRFLPHDYTVQVDPGTRLSDAALLAGIELGLPCGGQGRCGRCAVLIKDGAVVQQLDQRLSVEDVNAGYVMACQTKVDRDVTIFIPDKKIERKLQADRTAHQVNVPISYDYGRDQPLHKYVVTLTSPSIDEQTDDWSRLKRELASQHHIEGLTAQLPVLRRCASALRHGDWVVTIVIEMDRWDGPAGSPRLVDILPGDHQHNAAGQETLWGVAIDIGTTTNVVWLVNLITGEVVAQAAEYNGQIARGEDVISRIIYASKGTGEGLVELQNLVIRTLNHLITKVAQQAGIHTGLIYKATVSGNSTMLHLFTGLSPESIRLMPFITTVNQIPSVRASELGLQLCPDATVDCLPGVASYVGADITAGVLSSGLCNSDKLTLFIDVGTNGEIVFGDCTWLITSACSAGPAFEGAGVIHGMRATTGAIEEVWISAETYEPTIRVIGQPGEKPIGICGSGLIGLMADMFMTGVIDKSGNIDVHLPTERTRSGSYGGEYVVVWADQSATGEDIFVTDVDINNLMRAKAAIYAGFSVLTKSVGMSITDVEQILIGGAFGQYINIEKAIQIGLLPDAPWENFSYLGNTSVKGAYLALLSRDAREKVDRLAGMMTYLELSADNSFFDEFNAALFLPHTDTSQFPSVLDQLELIKDKAGRLRVFNDKVGSDF
ncbi:MAG: ASKHA domain-containing protein [Anaerolineae bacterium]|nr:ASKHA domain-containing protein [Anaerolineae bacterium]